MLDFSECVIVIVIDQLVRVIVFWVLRDMMKMRAQVIGSRSMHLLQWGKCLVDARRDLFHPRVLLTFDAHVHGTKSLCIV